jgi:hypothetical protein
LLQYFLAILIAFLFCPALLQSQDLKANPAGQTALNPVYLTINDKELYPNKSIKTIMTPTGWGSTRTYLFGALGGTFPHAYTGNSDLVAGAGFGTGNYYKAVSVVGIINVNDVSKFNGFSSSFIVSRHLGKGTSLSAGALNLFTNTIVPDNATSYFVAVSHAVQTIRSRDGFSSRLHFTLGAGTGRFYKKSHNDLKFGKGEHGTAVFANASYEVLNNFNLNIEWTGLNAGVGVAWRASYKFPAFAIGLMDLTGYSGDRLRLVCSVGHAFVLK